MSAAFAMTLDYLKTRVQFDVPIGELQALQHRAARLYVDQELARSAVMHARPMLDGLEGGAPVARAVSVAKAKCSEAFMAIAHEAVQMHGGIGMTDEHDIGLFLKRARVCEMTFGGTPPTTASASHGSAGSRAKTSTSSRADVDEQRDAWRGVARLSSTMPRRAGQTRNAAPRYAKRSPPREYRGGTATRVRGPPLPQGKPSSRMPRRACQARAAPRDDRSPAFAGRSLTSCCRPSPAARRSSSEAAPGRAPRSSPRRASPERPRPRRGHRDRHRGGDVGRGIVVNLDRAHSGVPRTLMSLFEPSTSSVFTSYEPFWRLSR